MSNQSRQTSSSPARSAPSSVSGSVVGVGASTSVPVKGPSNANPNPLNYARAAQPKDNHGQPVQNALPVEFGDFTPEEEYAESNGGFRMAPQQAPLTVKRNNSAPDTLRQPYNQPNQTLPIPINAPYHQVPSHSGSPPIAISRSPTQQPTVIPMIGVSSQGLQRPQQRQQQTQQNMMKQQQQQQLIPPEYYAQQQGFMPQYGRPPGPYFQNYPMQPPPIGIYPPYPIVPQPTFQPQQRSMPAQFAQPTTPVVTPPKRKGLQIVDPKTMQEVQIEEKKADAVVEADTQAKKEFTAIVKESLATDNDKTKKIESNDKAKLEENKDEKPKEDNSQREAKLAKEVEDKNKDDKEKKAQQEKLDEQKRKEAEEAKQAQEKAQKEAEKAKLEAEQKQIEEDRIKAEEEKKKKEAEEKAKQEAEEKAKKEAEEKAIKEAEDKARREAEEKEKVRKEAEEKAKKDSEALEAAEAEFTEAKSKKSKKKGGRKEDTSSITSPPVSANVSSANVFAVIEEKTSTNSIPGPSVQEPAPPVSSSIPTYAPIPAMVSPITVPAVNNAPVNPTLEPAAASVPSQPAPELQQTPAAAPPEPSKDKEEEDDWEKKEEVVVEVKPVIPEPEVRKAEPSIVNVNSSELLKNSVDYFMQFKEYRVVPYGFNPPEEIALKGGAYPPKQNNRPQFQPMGPGQFGGQPRVQDGRHGIQRTPSNGPPMPMQRTNSGGRPAPPGMGNRRSSDRNDRGGNVNSNPGQARGQNQRLPRAPSQSSVTIPIEQIVPLAITEKRWIPASKTVVADDETTREQGIFRRVKGMLNKLTVENFDILLVELLEVGITTPAILRGIISLVFDKALDEPNYAPTYAKLCLQIQLQLNQATLIEESTDENGTVVKTQQTFRRLLLNKCQDQFERKDMLLEEELLPEEKAKKTQEELDEIEYRRLKTKRHILGNITFIGELFKLNMLTEKIMHTCIQSLLKNIQNPDESDIECLCNLLKTVGKQLDHKEAANYFDTYFDRIKKIMASTVITPRIRFMLMDVTDLRADKWIPRRAEMKMQKIDDVRQEALAEQERARQSSSSRDGRTSDRRSSGRGGLPTRDQQMQKNTGVREKVDLSKLQKSQTSSDTSTGGATLLAPQRFQRAGKSADGSAMSRSTSGGSPTPAMANRFSGLSTEEPRSSSSRQETISEVSSPAASTLPAGEIKKKPTAEKLEKKYKTQIEEFLSIGDKQDFLQTIKENDSPEFNPRLIQLIYSLSVDKKPAELANAQSLIAFLVKEKVFSQKDVTDGLNLAFEELDDNAIDTPSLPNIAGDFVKAIIADGQLPLLLIKDLTSLLKQTAGGQVVAHAISALAGPVNDPQRSSTEELLRQRLSDAGINISDYAAQAIKNDKSKYYNWLQKNNLLFLEPLLVIEKELQSRLSSGEDSDSIIRWLNVAASKEMQHGRDFVRTLTTAVLQQATVTSSLAQGVSRTEKLSEDIRIKENEALSRYTPLLLRFLSEDNLRTEAVFAIQVFYVTHNKPYDFAQRIFGWFYEKNIIDGDSFLKWREDVDDKSPGKLETLEKTNSFFQKVEQDKEEDKS